MATEINLREHLQNELKKKRICRFCLSQARLTHIFAKDTSASLAPLPVQVMACASIEVFTNDGMPAWICYDCRLLFEHSYRFKQMCDKADTLLRQFPLTGEWPLPLQKPKFPKAGSTEAQTSLSSPQSLVPQSITITATPKAKGNNIASVQNAYKVTASQSKKILNSNPAAVPEPPVPIRTVLKKEPIIPTLDIFDKEGCTELSMEDVQLLIANVGDDEEFQSPSPVKRPPKVLNKGSIRILNKEANVVIEPKLSTPKVKLDQDGNVIVTAVIDSLMDYEQQGDNVKNAEPVATNVYPCPQCDRSFPLLQLRDIHMVNHTRERKFQCPDCDKSFFSKYDLQKHEVRHSGAKPYKCIVCEKGFSRATLLHRHEKVHTEIPKYLCIHCEKTFLSKDEMEQHTARHEKNRPFKCRVCQKTFAFKQGLERHEAVHSSVQPYPCQYCEQSFPTPSKLARHLTAHAGKRPYPCKYCNKSYVLSHHLSRHMRSHKQVKGSHTCSACNKVFKTREELIYHTAVHSTISLVCTLCLIKLDSVEFVTQHLKEHVDGDAFACEFCDLIFLHPNALIAHSEERHVKEMAVYNLDVKQSENPEVATTIASANTISLNSSMEKLDDDDDGDGDGEGDDENDNEECDLKFIVSEENRVEEKNERSKKNENTAMEKPKILNQIVLHTKKDPKYYMNVSSNKVSENNDIKQQEIVKKRRVISVDGHLKEIDCSPSDPTSSAPKRKVVIAQKKIEFKVEKDEKILAKTQNTSLERKLKATVQESSITPNTRSNETKTTDKTDPTPKRVVRKAVSSANGKPSSSNVATAAGASNESVSPTNMKKKIQPKVKQIRMSKSQAEALTKQGRIQIKDGNMILTKQSAPVTRMSKREK